MEMAGGLLQMRTKKNYWNVLKRRTMKELKQKGMAVVQSLKEWDRLCGGKNH